MYGRHSGRLFSGKNSTKYVVLGLYLIHHPDYPYNIAKNFRIAQAKGAWTSKKAKSLIYPNVVSQVMKKMKKEGLIVEYQIKRRRGRPSSSGSEKAQSLSHYGHKTKRYRIDPALCFIETEKRRFESPSQTEPVFNMIHDLSPSQIECIARIDTITEFDYFTFLTYAKGLLDEISHYARTKSDAIRSAKLKKTHFLLLSDFEKAYERAQAEFRKNGDIYVPIERIDELASKYERAISQLIIERYYPKSEWKKITLR